MSLIHVVNSSSYPAVVIHIDTTIDQGLVHLVNKATENINRNTVVILNINSYGGYLASADEIIETIRLRAKHCIAWVEEGSKAVSAAAYIALSCRRIYMAPGTVLGGVKPHPFDEKVVSYIESRLKSFLSEKINITEEIELFINQLVREGKSFTVDELAELGIVSRARELSEVLDKENIAKIESTHRAGLVESVISTITNPVISTLLVELGLLMIVVELLTVGFQGYAIPGVVMLITGLYGLLIVPIDILLLTLITIGTILLLIEFITPGFGILGVSGLVILGIGVFIGIYNMPPEARTMNIYVSLASIFMVSGFMLFIIYKAVSAIRLKKPTISEKLIGQIGYAKTDISEREPGVVYVLNEDWTAYSVKGLIKTGSKVRVVRVEGLKIYVEQVEKE